MSEPKQFARGNGMPSCVVITGGSHFLPGRAFRALVRLPQWDKLYENLCFLFILYKAVLEAASSKVFCAQLSSSSLKVKGLTVWTMDRPLR